MVSSAFSAAKQRLLDVNSFEPRQVNLFHPTSIRVDGVGEVVQLQALPEKSIPRESGSVVTRVFRAGRCLLKWARCILM